MFNHGDTEGKKMIAEQLTEQIIAAAMEGHRKLGPALLESAYEQCLFNVPLLKNGITRRVL